MIPDPLEYDPEYQAAYRETTEYHVKQLRYAIEDMGNEIAKALIPVMERTSLMLRAIFHEMHAEEFDAMSWYRRWWHTMVGHR